MAKLNPGDQITILVDGEPVLTEIDDHGTQRFIQNDVIRHLVDSGAIDLNRLAIDVHTQNLDGHAFQEFYMSLGYSVSGFDEIFGHGSSWKDNGREPVDILNPLWLRELTPEEVH